MTSPEHTARLLSSLDVQIVAAHSNLPRRNPTRHSPDTEPPVTPPDKKRPTAGSALRDVATELRHWADQLPDPETLTRPPDLPQLSRHVNTLDLLFIRMVSLSGFRAGQRESDPQHLDLTAAYGETVGRLAGVQHYLARTYAVAAELLTLPLRPGPFPHARHDMLTRRGTRSLAQARSSAVRTADSLSSHARFLDDLYQEQPLLTHEERRTARQTAAINGTSTSAAPRTAPSNSRPGARR